MDAAPGGSDRPPPWEIPVIEYADEPGARSGEKQVTPCPPIDWSALTGDPPPRVWWIQDWLGPSPMLVAGAGGAGKTRLMQMVGTSLATGRRYLETSVQPLRVLLWLCEDNQDEAWRQQVAINAHFRLDMSDLKLLYIVPRQGHDNTLMQVVHGNPYFTSLLAELRQQVNDLRIDVLVLDNLAQVFGGNESDRHHATHFVNGIAGLVQDRPFAPVLLGHIARTQGSEFSGSAAWENAVRMRWYLGAKLPDQIPDKDDEPVDPDTVYLARRKANYTSKDWRRLRFHNGVLIPDEPEEAGRRFDQTYRDDNAEQILLSAFDQLKGMGIVPSDARNSSDYLPKQIIAKRIAQAHTKQELEQAMNRLMKAGRLRRDVVGKYSNRQPRYGLVVP